MDLWSNSIATFALLVSLYSIHLDRKTSSDSLNFSHKINSRLIKRDRIKESIKAIKQFHNAINKYGDPDTILSRDANTIIKYSLIMIPFMNDWSLFMITNIASPKYIMNGLGYQLVDLDRLLSIVITVYGTKHKSYSNYIELLEKYGYTKNSDE